MVRTIVTPQDTHIELDIPKEYVGKEIEITLLPLDELTENTTGKPTMGNFWNIISDSTAKELRDHLEKGRSEWKENI